MFHIKSCFLDSLSHFSREEEVVRPDRRRRRGDHSASRGRGRNHRCSAEEVQKIWSVNKHEDNIVFGQKQINLPSFNVQGVLKRLGLSYEY